MLHHELVERFESPADAVQPWQPLAYACWDLVE